MTSLAENVPAAEKGLFISRRLKEREIPISNQFVNLHPKDVYKLLLTHHIHS